MSCVKAQGFLSKNKVSVEETIDAKKDRRGSEAALELAKSAKKVIVGRGKNVTTFDMKKDSPDDDTLLSHLLGPTGNLRAPTARIGDTLLVGFSEEAYRLMFGK